MSMSTNIGWSLQTPFRCDLLVWLLISARVMLTMSYWCNTYKYLIPPWQIHVYNYEVKCKRHMYIFGKFFIQKKKKKNLTYSFKKIPHYTHRMAMCKEYEFEVVWTLRKQADIEYFPGLCKILPSTVWVRSRFALTQWILIYVQHLFSYYTKAIVIVTKMFQSSSGHLASPSGK